MPCYDPRNDPDYVAREARAESKQEINRLSKRCHELTELLCEAGRARAERRRPALKVRNWWTQHAKLDAANGKPWPKPVR